MINCVSRKYHLAIPEIFSTHDGGVGVFQAYRIRRNLYLCPHIKQNV